MAQLLAQARTTIRLSFSDCAYGMRISKSATDDDH